MRYPRLALLPFVATALVLGCDDPASAPAESPDLRAAQGDRSEWTLVAELSQPESDPYGTFLIPCLNGGLGEEAVNFGGPYGIYYKTVVTPSGNIISQGWIRTEFDAWRSVATGDLWVGTMNAKLREFTRAADGHLLYQEPITEILVNQRTGERVRTQSMFRLEFDEEFNLVNNNPRNGEIFACHVMK